MAYTARIGLLGVGLRGAVVHAEVCAAALKVLTAGKAGHVAVDGEALLGRVAAPGGRPRRLGDTFGAAEPAEDLVRCRPDGAQAVLLEPLVEALEARQPGDGGGDAAIIRGAEVVALLKHDLGELRRSGPRQSHRSLHARPLLGSGSGAMRQARAVEVRAPDILALSTPTTSRGAVVGPPALLALVAAIGPVAAAMEVALVHALLLALVLRHVAGADGALIEDAVDAALKKKPQAEQIRFMRSRF